MGRVVALRSGCVFCHNWLVAQMCVCHIGGWLIVVLHEEWNRSRTLWGSLCSVAYSPALLACSARSPVRLARSLLFMVVPRLV